MLILLDNLKTLQFRRRTDSKVCKNNLWDVDSCGYKEDFENWKMFSFLLRLEKS